MNASCTNAPPCHSSPKGTYAELNRFFLAAIGGVALLIGMTLATTTHAASAIPLANINVPNGDFSNPANEGVVGGDLLGASGTSTIGSGPWAASYSGVASVLAQPSMIIGSGQARVSGLLGINLVGILNNRGYFHQDTGTAWIANRRYTLSADVDAATVLTASVLNSGNLGIALATSTSTASRVASTTGGNGVLTLLGGSTYRLSVEFETGPSVSGNIHAHLFAEPSGLIGAGLLSAVSFDNVTLSTHLLTQAPAALAPGATGPYTAVVGEAVSPALDVVVLDALGDPIPGISVTYSVPGSGASASVVPNPATTDSNGIAHAVITANTIAGAYQISASVDGLPTPLVFDLVNQAGPAATLGNSSGSGQSATAGVSFTSPLGLQVTDAFGNPVSGVEVTFTPPTNGASATFSPNPAVSDANGNVQTSVTANTIAGTYEVLAEVSGVSPPMVFELTNLAGPAAGIGSLSGSGQGAVTSTAFADPLGLQVQDEYGNAVAGATVTLTAPSSGASASLGSSILVSDSAGLVSTSATANSTAGAYAISVTVSGLGTIGSFSLVNLLDPLIGPQAPGGEPNQFAAVATPFACVLLVQITDGASNPMPDLSVAFVAPSSGASATLSNGESSGTAITVSTDADGFAFVEATANGIEGTYTVGAQLLYSLAAPVEFTLRNLAANDPIHANGFDGLCLPFVGTLQLPVAAD